MLVKNAHQNNLKHLNLKLPENQLIVVTGLSGSGKSSLAMEVIANEGVRYFMESLPAYNQQNGQVIPTADVDNIQHLPPVIKVEQSKRFQSIHSTFGTLSELTDVFRILFARYAGKQQMSKSLFSFNQPKGACKTCRGIGEAEYIDTQKLITNGSKTLREGALATTLPNGYTVYSQVTIEELDKVCQAHGFSVDRPWKDLTKEQQNVIWHGSDKLKVFYGKHSLASRLRWEGIKAKPREKGYYKGILTIMEDILRRDRNPNIIKFASSKLCPSCHGARIKSEMLAYHWRGRNFQEWMELPLTELYSILQHIKLTGGEALLTHKIYLKLKDLIHLGMGDYRLSTPSVELSSGDAQRIKLINRVNSKLQGILYIFDEPSIGLSATYQQYLLHILRRLINRGNSVMVVEHDLDFIRSADWIVELGPKAGTEGGEILFNGSIHDFLADKDLVSPTLTALASEKQDYQQQSIHLNPADFIPQKQQLTVIAQKTKQLRAQIEAYCQQEHLTCLTVNDQPIGKTPRSNPATYTGLADKIRNLFAKTESAKALKLSKSAFSFNSKVGRCVTCEGAGIKVLSMSALGTVNQVCPTCSGKRFKEYVLQAQWHHKSIAEVYQLSVNEAIHFFKEEKSIVNILNLMQHLGLGYLKLGQPSNTLSGGEAQRIKLTKHFAKKSKQTLLLLNEPSIGLHQENVKQLLVALHQLKTQTAGIICFENHPVFAAKSDIFVDNTTKNQPPKPVLEPPQQQNNIHIRGARTHQLKNLSLKIPKHQLTVVTGISGSGKSSLVIDTLHGFGLQEMTKQFSNYQQSRVGVNFQLEVDDVEGLTPTICVTRRQKNYSKRTDIAKQIGLDKILRFAFSRKAQFEGDELSASHFSNRHVLGQCSVCEGVGEELLPDIQKIVLDSDKSIVDGLFAHNKALDYYGDPQGKHMAIWQEVGKTYDFDLNVPFKVLTTEQRQLLFYGTGDKIWKTTWVYQTKDRQGNQDIQMKWEGISHYLQDEYYRTRKNKNIKKLTALFSYKACQHCQGSGLKPERLTVKIAQQSIADLKRMNFGELNNWLQQLSLQSDIDGKLANRIDKAIAKTIQKAQQLHIDHLQLHRKSVSLSGGETQRVELIKQLNSPLTGVTYLLDEPSAGLSTQNITDLIQILRELIAKGNTVIVIEHNKDLILAADKLLQIGPAAGAKGGYLTFQGSPEEFLKTDACHPFLKSPQHRVKLQSGNRHIYIKNIAKYTLNKTELQIPVGGITAISGPSGIGKTTLVKSVLLPSVTAHQPVNCTHIDFPKSYLAAYYFEPQQLRSHRKTLLVDYLNLLPAITKLFAKESGLKASYFSYKNKKSQCADCKGLGYIETALDIVANAVEECETCKGQRYQATVLTHQIKSKNIAEILDLPLHELAEWLDRLSVKIKTLINDLKEIGLGHLRLNQPVQSLSSGEKQRLLLRNWLQNSTTDALYILDEPSIGLHYADIDLLYTMLKKLSAQNDVIVIDHNPYLLEKIKIGVRLE